MITKTFIQLQTHIAASDLSCLCRVTMSEALKALSSADKQTVVNSDYLCGSTLGSSVSHDFHCLSGRSTCSPVRRNKTHWMTLVQVVICKSLKYFRIRQAMVEEFTNNKNYQYSSESFWIKSL